MPFLYSRSSSRSVHYFMNPHALFVCTMNTAGRRLQRSGGGSVNPKERGVANVNPGGYFKVGGLPHVGKWTDLIRWSHVEAF